jgi:hypothetical protein
MITLEQFKENGVVVSNELIGNAALEFIAENTTLTVDLDDVETLKALPFSAKLFISRYDEVVSASSVVASESIEGLSQSFNTGDKSNMIWDLANTLLGGYLKGRIRYVQAQRRWH